MVHPPPPKSNTEISDISADFNRGRYIYEKKSSSGGSDSEEKKEDLFEDHATRIETRTDYASSNPIATSFANNVAGSNGTVNTTHLRKPSAEFVKNNTVNIVGSDFNSCDTSSPELVTNKSAASTEKNTVIPQDLRRSGRKRTSTTMTVQGHTIKKINNYIVKGLTYVHGTFQEDAPKNAPIKKAKNDDKKPPAPRKVPVHIKQRHMHNDIIKARAASDKAKRLDFMTKHYDVIEPFIDDKVKKLLKANKIKADSVPNDKILGTQPDIVTTTLRDYQMTGLDWMVKMHEKGMPLILGDEMGLGKTLQTISLIAYLKESKKFTGPSLVICPLSVIYSWCNEVKMHAPSLRCFRFHASDPNERVDQKDTMLTDVLKYDVVVTTYEMVKNPTCANLFHITHFNLCVLDEGHVIKNIHAEISHFARKIHSQNKLILTGTPLQNNLVELYAILNYLYPEYFTTPNAFERAFDISRNQIDPDMLLKANRMLKVFMMRRLKVEVEKLMPKKIETKILCPLSSSQIFIYKGYLMNDIESLAKMSEDENLDDKHRANFLRNLVMQLRKICLHPYLFDFAEPDAINTSVEELIATSGKLAVLDKLLISMFKNGHRTCIFSQLTSMLDILEDYCILRGWRYCRFDGSTPRAQRNHLINQFNSPGSDDFIFLMSTRSGGLGINLQTADTCILYDSDWNPQPDLQAMARVHRIGQKKTVHVYRLVSSGTVEERILERAEKKLYLDQMVNGGTSNQETESKNGSGLSAKELLATLKFGSDAVFSSTNNLPTEADIAKVVDRNRIEESSNGLLKGGITKNVIDYKTDQELTDTRMFGGVDFRKLREMKERSNGSKGLKGIDNLRKEWRELHEGSPEDFGKGRRDKKSRIVNLDGMGSGYGNAFVPVLAMNNYDLQSGEPSVWRETKKPKAAPEKKPKSTFSNQDFCQICGDGGELIACPQCPISVHSDCCGIRPKDFHKCSHHNCHNCNKNAIGGGGLLYRCQSCPEAYCPDCLPVSDEIRFLGKDIPRFEKLGFECKPAYHYIHCSKICENVAKTEFGFTANALKATCPVDIDVSYAFGVDALSVGDLAKKFRRQGHQSGQGM
mmetsp:Transcript_30304/g.61133  ORF Transcript_30304/g.61133 Transcript_30304/m.61133 type:complete len:1089 (+) Transcript_30304:168-3434(+)